MQPWDFIITVDNRGIKNDSNRVESGEKSTQVFYRESHTNPYVFAQGFPDTVLAVPVA